MGMDGQAILLAQIRAAEADLDAVEAMLRAQVFDGFPERDEILARLMVPIVEQRGRLASARGAAGTAAAWNHLDAARLGSVAPFREALALLGGMLLRQADLDDDVVLMSWVLQAELAERLRKVAWPKASVPDVEERYHRVSELIRVRFPTTTIWSLPVVAHEVGHAVVARFSEVVPGTSNDRLAFQTEFTSVEQRELLCDVIATLALGPAYVSACLLLRFAPSSADEAFGRHPPERERAEVMLQVLRGMSYEDTEERLRTAWASAMRSAAVDEPDAANVTELGRLARRIHSFTVARLPDLPYAGMDRADELAADIEALRDPPGRPRMVDALNAAWLVRRRRCDSEGALDDATAAACHELCRTAARGPGGTP
jgi:hypothetical protein